jgi:nucleoside-diphosphate-sugar epimerase
MRILITGGAGFIGYHLARRLAPRPGVSIVLADNLERGREDYDLQALLDGWPNVELRKVDLTDPGAFRGLGREIDQVYHLAAVNGTRWFYEAPDRVLRTNTLTTVNVLDWIVSLPRPPKLMFTSSNEAYAGALSAFQRLPIPTPEEVPLVVEDPYNPRWSYAATKLTGELFVIHYARRYRFPAIIVRPHNFYGPRAGFDHVIPELAQQALRRTDPFPLSSPEATRSFCYVEDAVEAMALLMDNPQIGLDRAETVHVGSGQEIRIADLADAIFRLLEWRPGQLDVRAAPRGSVNRRLPDVSKIRRLVGWDARTTLDAGLRPTLAWYAAQAGRR